MSERASERRRCGASSIHWGECGVCVVDEPLDFHEPALDPWMSWHRHRWHGLWPPGLRATTKEPWGLHEVRCYGAVDTDAPQRARPAAGCPYGAQLAGGPILACDSFKSAPTTTAAADIAYESDIDDDDDAEQPRDRPPWQPGRCSRSRAASPPLPAPVQLARDSSNRKPSRLSSSGHQRGATPAARPSSRARRYATCPQAIDTAVPAPTDAYIHQGEERES